jgi:hypothetical protein
MAAVTVLLLAGSLALAYTDRHLLPVSKATWTPANLSGVVISFSTPVVGYVIASRRPANRIGWLILAGGLALGIADICDEYALRALVAAPGSLPYGRAAEWLSRWVGLIPLSCLAFVLMLFPTGRLPSRRWRPAAWFAGGAFTFTVAAALVGATRVVWSHPFAPYKQAVTPGVFAVTLVAFPAAFLISGAAVVVRFIRSTGEERLQLKWFAAAAALVVVTAIPLILTNSPASAIINNLALVCLEVAVAVAVLKYRLYDIDIVISRPSCTGCSPPSSPRSMPGLSSAWERSPATRATRCWPRSPRLSWRWPSSRYAAGRGCWRTGSRTAAGPRPTRCCPTSPAGSAAPTQAMRCCRRWRASSRRGPAPGGS